MEPSLWTMSLRPRSSVTPTTCWGSQDCSCIWSGCAWRVLQQRGKMSNGFVSNYRPTDFNHSLTANKNLALGVLIMLVSKLASLHLELSPAFSSHASVVWWNWNLWTSLCFCSTKPMSSSLGQLTPGWCVSSLLLWPTVSPAPLLSLLVSFIASLLRHTGPLLIELLVTGHT